MHFMEIEELDHNARVAVVARSFRQASDPEPLFAALEGGDSGRRMLAVLGAGLVGDTDRLMAGLCDPSVRVRLTQKGREIRDVVSALFIRHAEGLQSRGVIGPEGIEDITSALKRVERYWTDQIRYIY